MAGPWPAQHHYLTTDERNALSDACRTPVCEELRALRLPDELLALLDTFYLPLASWLQHAHTNHDGPLLVGVCGGQGSGKSTLCSLLRRVLNDAFDLRVVCLSIDDLYKTREQRRALADAVHPLFVTRGVPGTHDTALGITLLDRLMRQDEGQATPIPVFDKALDDRKQRACWPSHEGPVDIILFEGWCVGARAEQDSALETPVNALERDEDAQACWRKHTNEALRTDYAELFARLDLLMLLEVDDFDQVFEWRQLQERKLAEQLTGSTDNRDNSGVMTEREVSRFVMHYERLTRHILREMPGRADLVVHLDDSHNAHHTTVNRVFPGRRVFPC